MAKVKSETFYQIQYRDPKDNKIVVLKARRIEDSSLGLSFVRISEFIFETQSLLVQPEEHALEKRFEKVRSLHLSIYSIVSVEEIGPPPPHRGRSRDSRLKFRKNKSNLIAFPSELQNPK